MVGIIGRTNLDGKFLELEGQLYEIDPLVDETTEPGYGYRVQTARFVGERRDRMDVAKATVYPNSTTPPQFVKRTGRISDYPMRGEGEFVIWRPGIGLERIPYNGRDSSQYNLRIDYAAGCYQFWRAGNGQLTFIEICEPPYQEGDLKNLKITDDMPEEFRQEHRSLVKG